MDINEIALKKHYELNGKIEVVSRAALKQEMIFLYFIHLV